MKRIAHICKVQNCNKTCDSHGFCSSHAAKWRKYGDPLFSINETHGMSHIREYWVLAGMKRRCYNKNEKAYTNYGGRGITICDRWLNSFLAFYEDMGARPSPKHSIERIDNDGNYEPSNCRWATHQEQANNNRWNKPITINGITKNIERWRRDLSLPNSTYQNRINRGWSIEKALLTPRMTQYSKYN